MSFAPPSTVHQVERGSPTTVWRGRVFGLDLEASLPLVGFVPSAGGRAPSAVLRAATAAELRDLWPQSSQLLLSWRPAGGNRTMTVEHAPGVGYRVWALRHGTHVVFEGGTHVASAPPAWGGWRWQRLLFAHALPLAARLQGYELLHASAVRRGESVVAFVASSGTGKSTLAANLVARGWGFVTDDVLAVACANGKVTAHPGPSLMGLVNAEYDSLPADTRTLLGARLGRRGKRRSGKPYFTTPVTPGPARLAAICFLERADAGGEAILEEQHPPEPRLLLGAGFLPYLTSHENLVRHLDSCMEIAAATRAFTLRAPAHMSPAELARGVERQLLSSLGDPRS